MTEIVTRRNESSHSTVEPAGTSPYVGLNGSVTDRAAVRTSTSSPSMIPTASRSARTHVERGVAEVVDVDDLGVQVVAVEPALPAAEAGTASRRDTRGPTSARSSPAASRAATGDIDVTTAEYGASAAAATAATLVDLVRLHDAAGRVPRQRRQPVVRRDEDRAVGRADGDTARETDRLERLDEREADADRQVGDGAGERDRAVFDVLRETA